VKKTETRKFKRRLELKETEVIEAVVKRESIAVVTEGDELDKLRSAAERELALSNLSRESHLLKEIRAALKRIADGSFGSCASCDEPIPIRRLEAVPWTPFCLSCQQRHEQLARFAA